MMINSRSQEIPLLDTPSKTTIKYILVRSAPKSSESVRTRVVPTVNYKLWA